MIIILNGPCGVGKTEVSWKLVERFDRGVMLDGDYVGAVHPFEIYDQERVSYLYRTLGQLVAFHQSQGNYAHFVINYVFETPESLAELRRLLGQLDDVTYAFRLTASESEMERRIRSRHTHQVTWELARFRELERIIEAGAERGDMGYPIDTTGLSTAEAADAIWRNIHEEVDLVPYQPIWQELFAREKTQIQQALAHLQIPLEIHHIGSTAVPGLIAKPVIDIMLVLKRLEQAISCISPLRRLGYHFIDYPQNTERRFFRKGEPRSHHLHIVEAGGAECRDHLLFRNALRSSSALRKEYAALKESLAQRHKKDRATYSERKSALVARVIKNR